MKYCKICLKITFENKSEPIRIAKTLGYDNCDNIQDAIGYINGYDRDYIIWKFCKDLITCKTCKIQLDKARQCRFPQIPKSKEEIEKIRELNISQSNKRDNIC